MLKHSFLVVALAIQPYTFTPRRAGASFAVLVALIGGLSLFQMGRAMSALHDVADVEGAGLTAAFEIRGASLAQQRDLRTLVFFHSTSSARCRC